MHNDTNLINDLVTKTAEANQANQNDIGNQQSSQQQGGGSNEGGVAEEAAKPKEEQSSEAAKPKEETATAPDKIAELLKELGIENIDTLKEKLKGKEPAKVLTAEEKEKQDAIYEADLQKFGVESGDMKLEDFHQLKTVKSKADAELVFEKFLDTWKEENPDVTDDIEDAARTDFETEYNLNSTKDKTKARGIAKLAKDAKELRNPLESSFEKVKSKFDGQRELIETLPVFNKSIEDVTKTLVPEKVEWFKGKDGEEDVAIDIELTPEEKKEITDKVIEKFRKPETYLLFKEGKQEDIKEAIKEYAEKLSEKATRERANLKVTEKFTEIAQKHFQKGSETGAKVGANNSFAVNQAKGKAAGDIKNTQTKEEAKKEILGQFGKK